MVKDPSTSSIKFEKLKKISGNVLQRKKRRRKNAVVVNLKPKWSQKFIGLFVMEKKLARFKEFSVGSVGAIFTFGCSQMFGPELFAFGGRP